MILVMDNTGRTGAVCLQENMVFSAVAKHCMEAFQAGTGLFIIDLKTWLSCSGDPFSVNIMISMLGWLLFIARLVTFGLPRGKHDRARARRCPRTSEYDGPHRLQSIHPLLRCQKLQVQSRNQWRQQ